MFKNSGEANAASKFTLLKGPATAALSREPERYLNDFLDEIRDVLANVSRVKGTNIMQLELSTSAYAAIAANTALVHCQARAVEERNCPSRFAVEEQYVPLPL